MGEMKGEWSQALALSTEKGVKEREQIGQNVNIYSKQWVHGCLLHYFLYVCNISQLKVKYYFKKE